jgi:hypothetical protein
MLRTSSSYFYNIWGKKLADEIFRLEDKRIQNARLIELKCNDEMINLWNNLSVHTCQSFTDTDLQILMSRTIGAIKDEIINSLKTCKDFSVLKFYGFEILEYFNYDEIADLLTIALCANPQNDIFLQLLKNNFHFHCQYPEQFYLILKYCDQGDGIIYKFITSNLSKSREHLYYKYYMKDCSDLDLIFNYPKINKLAKYNFFVKINDYNYEDTSADIIPILSNVAIPDLSNIINSYVNGIPLIYDRTNKILDDFLTDKNDYIFEKQLDEIFDVNDHSLLEINNNFDNDSDYSYSD